MDTSSIQPVHCGSHEMHASPGKYKYWQLEYADRCRRSGEDLLNVYKNQLRRQIEYDIKSRTRLITDEEAKLALLETHKITAPQRIQEIEAAIAACPETNRFARDKLMQDLADVQNIDKAIRSVKMYIGKLKKQIRTLQDENANMEADHIKHGLEMYVRQYILRYGYMPDVWAGIENLLPGNTPPYTG